MNRLFNRALFAVFAFSLAVCLALAPDLSLADGSSSFQHVLGADGKHLPATLRWQIKTDFNSQTPISSNAATGTGYVTTVTATATCSAARFVLTCSGVSGTPAVGAVLTSTGGVAQPGSVSTNLPLNTTIVRIIDSTHFTLNQEPVLPTSTWSGSVTMTYGLFTVSTITSGAILPGDVFQMAGEYLPTGIVSQVSGVNTQAGGYVLNQSTAIASSGSPIAFNTQTAPVWSTTSTEIYHATSAYCTISAGSLNVLTVASHYRGTWEPMDVIAQHPSITIQSYGTATGGNGTYNILNPLSITLSSAQCSANQRIDLATSGANNGPQGVFAPVTYLNAPPVINGQVVTGPYVQPDATISTGLHASGPLATSQAFGMMFEHWGSYIEVCGSGAGSKYQWWINDKPLFPQAVIVSGTSCQQLDFGLFAHRLVKVECWNCGFSNINIGINDVLTKAPPRGPEFGCYFDSLGGGAMAAGSTVSDVCTILASLLGADDIRPVYSGGTGFVANNNGASPTFAEHVADLVAQHPEVVVIGTGVNDQSNDPTAVYNSALSTFGQFRAGLPDAWLIYVNYRQQGPAGGSNPWTSNSLAVSASIKAAAAVYNVAYIDPDEPANGNVYGTEAGDSAAGSITGYVVPGSPDTLNVVTSAIYLYPGNLVTVNGQQIAIATAPGGGGAGACTLASYGVTSGSVGSPVTYPVALGATLVSATSVGASSITTANALVRGGVFEIDTGMSTVERFQVLDYNVSTNYISTIVGTLRFAHSANAYLKQVPTADMTGSDNVGSSTSPVYGNSVWRVTTDGTHPTEAGGAPLAWAALAELLRRTAPN